MISRLLLVICCFVAYSKALECGIAKVSSDKIKETLSTCVKNNETLEKIWEMAMSSTSSTEPKESSNESSSEEPSVQTTNKTRENRNRRATGKVQGTKIQVNEKRSDDGTLVANATDASTEHPDTTTTNSMESSANCVVHCVFEHLNMTDEKGLPSHEKVVEGLLKSAAGRELRVFLQESTDECFQQISQENNLDSCGFSTQLITCLADKGRVNCSDWPAGNLPF